MAYSQFTNYDFYTAPPIDDKPFTRQMIAQTAAEHSAKMRAREDRQAREKKELLDLNEKVGFSSDQKEINDRTQKLWNDVISNEGRVSEEHKKEVSDIQGRANLMRIDSEKYNQGLAIAKELKAKNPLLNYDKMSERIQQASNKKHDEGRSEALSQSLADMGGYKDYDETATINAFAAPLTKNSNKVTETFENTNGVTTAREFTTKAPFFIQRQEADKNGNIIIKSNPGVSENHVQAFVETPEGHNIFRQQIDKLSTNEGYVTNLENKAVREATRAAQMAGRQPDQSDIESAKAIIMNNDAKTEIKKKLETLNNLYLQQDRSTSTKRGETPEQKSAAKKAEKYTGVYSDKPESIGIKASSPRAIVKRATGKVIGETDETIDREIQTFGTVHIDSPKGLIMSLPNRNSVNLSKSKDEGSVEGNTPVKVTSVRIANSNDGTDIAFGKRKDTGKRVLIVTGHEVDVSAEGNDISSENELENRYASAREKKKGYEQKKKEKRDVVYKIDLDDTKRIKEITGLDSEIDKLVEQYQSHSTKKTNDPLGLF